MLNEELSRLYGLEYGMVIKTANHYSRTLVCRNADYEKNFKTKIEDSRISTGVVAYTIIINSETVWKINHFEEMKYFGYIKKDEPVFFNHLEDLTLALIVYLKRASYGMRFNTNEERARLWMQLLILTKYKSLVFCNKLQKNPDFKESDIIKISQILNAEPDLTADELLEVLKLPTTFIESIYDFKVKTFLTSYIFK
jgi:hypothetical protein